MSRRSWEQSSRWARGTPKHVPKGSIAEDEGGLESTEDFAMVWRLCQSDNNLSSERTEARNKPVQGWRGWFDGENGEGCEDRCPRREKVIVWERR